MKPSDILFEKQGPIAIATLNRPKVLNAFRQQTFQDLFAILEAVKHDDDVRVLIITGQGRAFCAGEDLAELSQSLDTVSEHEARGLLETFQRVTRELTEHPKIMIAALNGLAVGFGAELAIASDVRIASETASFTFAEAKRGLFQTNGVMYLLPRLIGVGRAASMFLTAEKCSVTRALEYGLVTQVVAPEALLETAKQLAKQIAGNAPISVRLIKQVLRQSTTLEDALQLEVNGMLECLYSEDLREGTRAFLEKRVPVYVGK
jgi:enoyl-CoA hydratase/carnithine racemase